MLEVNFLLILSQRLLSLFAGIVGIGFLIGFHELGHFLFCKLFKIKTPSFSIGFGPQIFSRKIGETIFSLSAIPFGGYVEIAGAVEPGQGEQKEALSDDKFSFRHKPYWQKMLVMGGGILFNLLFAYIVFIALHMTGIPSNSILYRNQGRPVIALVEDNSPAFSAGIKKNDLIVSIDNVQTNTIGDLLEFIQKHPNQTVDIVINRDKNQVKSNITIGSHKEHPTIGFFGVSFEESPIAPQPIFTSIKNGIALTNTWIKNTIIGFSQLIKKKDTSNMAGPIAIVGIAAQSAQAGIKLLLILLAIISINLAVLNIIPLPILDGGQALTYTIEAIIGKNIPIKVREAIHIATWICFMILFVYLTAKDINLLIGSHIKEFLHGLFKLVTSQ